MALIEQFIDACELILLGLVVVWTIGIAIALLRPVARERNGVVEIYAVVAEDSQPGA